MIKVNDWVWCGVNKIPIRSGNECKVGRICDKERDTVLGRHLFQVDQILDESRGTIRVRFLHTIWQASSTSDLVKPLVTWFLSDGLYTKKEDSDKIHSPCEDCKTYCNQWCRIIK